jgi:hypothetical protein
MQPSARIQQSSGKGHGTPGFIIPAIYGIGWGSSYAADFHDITSASNGTYSTEKGYDLMTGWGSPNGVSLNQCVGAMRQL